MADEPTRIAPARRGDDALTVRVVGDELVVLDRRIDVVHRLTPAMAQVWPLLDGRRSVREIASATGLEVDVVEAVLVRMAETDLVELPKGPDRRSFLRTGTLVGAAALAVPAIDSVLAPPAAAAGSACGSLTMSLSSCTYFGPPYNVYASNNFAASLKGFGSASGNFSIALTITNANKAGNTTAGTATGTLSNGSGTGTGTTANPSPYFHIDSGSSYSAVVTYTAGGKTVVCGPYVGTISC